MRLKELIGVLPLIVSTPCLAQSALKDFDEVCRIFIEAHNTNMSGDGKSHYITSNVHDRISNPEVLSAFDGIVTIDQKDRYAVFDQIADEITGREWECPTMETMMLEHAD